MNGRQDSPPVRWKHWTIANSSVVEKLREKPFFENAKCNSAFARRDRYEFVWEQLKFSESFSSFLLENEQKKIDKEEKLKIK